MAEDIDLKGRLLGLYEYCKETSLPVAQNEDGTLTIGLPEQKETSLPVIKNEGGTLAIGLPEQKEKKE